MLALALRLGLDSESLRLGRYVKFCLFGTNKFAFPSVDQSRRLRRFNAYDKLSSFCGVSGTGLYPGSLRVIAVKLGTLGQPDCNANWVGADSGRMLSVDKWR